MSAAYGSFRIGSPLSRFNGQLLRQLCHLCISVHLNREGRILVGGHRDYILTPALGIFTLLCNSPFQPDCIVLKQFNPGSSLKLN